MKKFLQEEDLDLQDAKPSVEIVYQIRNATPVGLKGDYHELCKKAYNHNPY